MQVFFKERRDAARKTLLQDQGVQCTGVQNRVIWVVATSTECETRAAARATVSLCLGVPHGQFHHCERAQYASVSVVIERMEHVTPFSYPPPIVNHQNFSIFPATNS